MDSRLAMSAIRLGMTGMAHQAQAPLRWASSVARHAGGSWLRCRVAGLGVSLLVHAPLVWVLSAVAPIPLPVESGVDSIAAVTARNQPSVVPAITIAEPWSQLVSDPMPLTRDVVRESDLLSGALQPVESVSAPPIIRVLEVDVSDRMLSHTNVRRTAKPSAVVVWPARLTVSEFARRWTTSMVARRAASVEAIPRSKAAGETARPRSDAGRDAQSVAKPTVAKPTVAELPRAELPRVTRSSPTAADVVQAHQRRNPEPLKTARPQVANQPSPSRPRRDTSASDRAAQDRESVASRRSSGRQVDQLPRKLPRNPQPVYPVDAWRAGRAGRVVLLVRVDDGGRVRDAGVHSSSGTRSLDQAALAAVRRWKFRPALRGNRPVEHAVLVPVSFRIER